MTRDEALLMAIEAIENADYHNDLQAIAVIKDIMANVATNDTSQERVDKTSESVHEPVQWGVDWGRTGDSPCVSIIKRLPDGRIEVVAVEYGPQRTWVGLTLDERLELAEDVDWPAGAYCEYAEKIEIKLKEKNI